MQNPKSCSTFASKTLKRLGHDGIGDIIESLGVTIQVTEVRGNVYTDRVYPSYKGIALTKSLKPRKDGWVTELYDCGDRIISLIKKAQ